MIKYKSYKEENMYKFLKETIDDFNLHARVVPALIIALPVYIYLMLKHIIALNFVDTILTNSGIFLLLIIVFYKVIRNLGKKYEKKMYKELMAKPTTIILRYSNNLIDEISKDRYHKKLNEKVKGLRLPIKKENEVKEDDIKYESAINWLRKYANSNRDKEPRVYQELKDYNFWRNLYGGKVLIICSCLICIMIEIINLMEYGIKQLVNTPYPIIMPILVMTIILILSCLIINKKVVKSKAFDYAKTLLEVCDNL